MLPPTPFSLLCAILLCLPLAVIFTFTAPTSTVSSSATAATSPLPLPPPLPLPITSTNYTTKTTLATDSLSPRKTLARKNLTLTAAAAPPPPPPPPLPPPSPEDEAEDQSLLKLASRVDPTPRPTKKLALMFLTTGPLPFAPLWERFFSRAAAGRYNVYVHADPGGGVASYGGVFANRSIPSKPTRRHTPTLIAAARRLLARALLHDSSNAMFALLSPSCVPIHSFNYTYRILMRSRRSFVEILKNEPGAYERWAARGEEAMEPEVGYEDFRVGSQFWVVRRRHAKVIVRDRRLWSKFKLPCLRDDTCYPEEHYFPTLLSMVDPRGCTPCTLTHVDWRGSHGGHPRTYVADEVGPELIRALRKSRPRYGDEEGSGSDGYNSSVTAVRRRRDPFLFARKFHPGALGRLVDIANDVLFKD